MVSPNNENVKLWMPINEGTGTACMDSSGNNHHGTIINASWEDINAYEEGLPITATSSHPTGALLQDKTTLTSGNALIIL